MFVLYICRGGDNNVFSMLGNSIMLILSIYHVRFISGTQKVAKTDVTTPNINFKLLSLFEHVLLECYRLIIHCH